MRRLVPFLIALCWSTAVAAQAAPDAPPSTPSPEPQPAPETAPPEGEPAAPTEPTEPASEAPSEPTEPAAPEAVEPPPPPPAEPVAPPPPPTTVPSPAELEARLAQELPPVADVPAASTAPVPVLTLHGYMRMRGELMDTFWLDRPAMADVVAESTDPERDRAAQGPDPFTRFRPLERRVAEMGAQSTCADEDTLSNGTCDVSTLRFANMRLRLSPQLNLSEDVRVHFTIDALDNYVAGEPPATYYSATNIDGSELEGVTGQRTVFAGTTVPGEEYDFGDSIKVRRAWAEVRNRDLGELRFGRMPMQWGLGMVYNAGNRLDDDLSTELDRVLGITKLAGLYISASMDFLSEGLFLESDPVRPLDQSQLDDVDQFTFSVARRHDPEELSAALERGDLVLNGGLQLVLRSQDSIYTPPVAATDTALRTINASTTTADLWGLLRYRTLRVELEAAWTSGSIDSLSEGGGTNDISQLGYALETELRLVDEKLGLYFDHGLATGDDSVEGLSTGADFVTRQEIAPNDTISTFRFHPSYRVDLILWRNLMGQVTGAYYFKPGISYDFIRNAFGEQLGARLDIVWSRASSPVQTWGNATDLGVELDLSLYFRSEDGPELDDGFHAMAQYGVLFPLDGLGYNDEDSNLDAAQTLRLILGVMF